MRQSTLLVAFINFSTKQPKLKDFLAVFLIVYAYKFLLILFNDKVKCIIFIIPRDSKYTKSEVQFYINMFIKLACQFKETHL